MRSAESYIRDPRDSFKKLKGLGSVPQNALLVTADVVVLYPSIPHQEGLEALSGKLDQQRKNLCGGSLEMTRFVCKNNYSEFDLMIKQLM